MRVSKRRQPKPADFDVESFLSQRAPDLPGIEDGWLAGFIAEAAADQDDFFQGWEDARRCVRCGNTGVLLNSEIRSFCDCSEGDKRRREDAENIQVRALLMALEPLASAWWIDAPTGRPWPKPKRRRRKKPDPMQTQEAA